MCHFQAMNRVYFLVVVKKIMLQNVPKLWIAQKNLSFYNPKGAIRQFAYYVC